MTDHTQLEKLLRDTRELLASVEYNLSAPHWTPLRRWMILEKITKGRKEIDEALPPPNRKEPTQ